MTSVGRNAFLGTPKEVDLDDPGSVLLLSTFDQKRFDIGLYEHFQIDRPDTLSKAVEKRQAEYLAGRSLAQDAFLHFGKKAPQIPIGQHRAPVWPNGFQGSISHSKQYVACLLTTQPKQFVGVDIEHDLTDSALRSVKQVTLQTSELSLLTHQTKLPEEQLACAIFSAKETLFKALYPVVQRFFGFDAAICTTVNDTSLLMELTQDLHPNLLTGHTFNVQIQLHEGYVLTWLKYQT